MSDLAKLKFEVLEKGNKRRQHIHIQYDGLGFIPLNELLASEKA